MLLQCRTRKLPAPPTGLGSSPRREGGTGGWWCGAEWGVRDGRVRGGMKVRGCWEPGTVRGSMGCSACLSKLQQGQYHSSSLTAPPPYVHTAGSCHVSPSFIPISLSCCSAASLPPAKLTEMVFSIALNLALFSLLLAGLPACYHPLLLL